METTGPASEKILAAKDAPTNERRRRKKKNAPNPANKIGRRTKKLNPSTGGRSKRIGSVGKNRI